MKLDKPPKKDFANHLHEYFNEIAKTLTGGFLNPLIEVILPSFHQKQFEKWCSDVYRTLIELENEKITLDQLRDNNEFVSILKQTMVIASKNHEIEKLNMLKTALLNSLNTSISFDSKLIFTKMIDRLSVSHHLVLKILNEKIVDFKDLNKYQDIYNTFINFVPNSIISKRQFVYILDELERNRLIKLSKDIEDDKKVKEASGFTEGYGDSNLPFVIVTEFGKDYLNFILDNE